MVTRLGGVTGQTRLQQVSVKRLKSRVFDNRQHIQQTARLLAGVDALAVVALEVGILWLAPHQPQPSPNGLFQQNGRLAAAQRHDDANVVHIETLAQHQHADDDARGGVLIDVEQALAHGCPVSFTQLGFFARVDGHHLVLAQPLVLQKLAHQRRHSGVFAHHPHFGVAVGVDAGKICLQLAQLMQTRPQHHPLALTEHGLSVLVAFGFEGQRQRTHLFALVQHQRLDQSRTHGGFEVKVGDDV